MAKKEKFTSGEFNLDGDLDFGNYDFGDSSGGRKQKDDRRPAMKTASNFAKGSIGGLKSTATSSAKIAKAIRAGMPKEYGDVVDRTGEVSSQLSSLYNDANAKIKPELQKIAKQMDKLVPEEMKRTKGVLGKIKKALGVDESARQSSSMEEDNEGNIQGQLAEVFSVQAEDSLKARAEDRAERKLNQKVDAKRFESSFGLLNSINVNMARMAGYTTKVNNAFQKKSLELQYRSYYVQQDILKTNKELLAMMDERTQAIQKNTGLPDFVKRNMSEDFKDMTRRKMLGSVGGFLGRGLKNVANAGKNKISDYAMMLQQASMGLEMAGDAKEMMKTQKEMNESMGIQDTGKAGMAGDMVGSMGMEALIKRLGKGINSKYFKQGSKQSNFLFDVLSKLNNGEREARKFQNKHLQQDYSASGFKGNASNWMKGLGSDFLDLFLAGGKQSHTFEKQMGHGLNKLHDSAEFNQMTQKSIVTIIPGFLSRIHGEIRALRTQQEPGELLEFDARRGQFAMTGKIRESTKQHLQKTINEGGLSYNLDKIHGHITQGSTISKGASEALRKKLHQHTFNSDGFDVEDLHHPDFTKGMSKQHAKEIQSAVGKRFNKDDASYAKNRSELTKMGRGAIDSVKDIDEELQRLIDGGQEKVLLDLKIIEPSGDGFIATKDAYRKLSESGMMEEGRFKTSDFFAKTNFKNFSGKKALDAIKNSKVSKWMYKKGRGDGGTHVGPMAQDLNRELGDEAAPGGKAIDLVTMNGVNMAAINELRQQMNQRQGGRGKGRGNNANSILSSIDKNTCAIVERLDAMGRLTFGIPKLDTKGLQVAVKKHSDNIADKFNQGKEAIAGQLSGMQAPKGVLGHAKNVAVSAGSILGTILEKAFSFSKDAGTRLREASGKVGDAAKNTFDKTKDPAMGAGKWIYEKGVSLVGKVFDTVSKTTTDILQNKLPAGWGEVMKGAAWLGDKAKSVIDPPRDVYVNGREQPALRAIIMRAGGYFDQISKKSIKRPSDIKGPVIDSDGNVVLSVDDIEKGVHDAEGNEIKSIMSILSGGIASIAGAAGEKFGNILGKFKGLDGKIGGKLKDFGGKLKDGIGIGGNGRVVSVLTEIRDMLNQRLPGRKIKFPSLSETSTGGTGSLSTAVAGAASSATAMAGNLGEAASEAGQNLLNSGKDAFGKLGGKLAGTKFGSGLLGKFKGLRSRFGKKGEEAAEAPELMGPKKPGFFSSMMRGLAGAKNRLTGQGQNQQGIVDPHSIHAQEGQREGGTDQQFAIQAAREAKRKSETHVAVADNAPRYKGKNIFDAATDAAKGAFGSIMGGLSDLAGLVFGGKGGLLGKGLKLAGGAARLAGSVAMGVGRFALGTVARVGVGAAMSGLGVATGGVLGTGMALGGALLTALTSPVGLTLAATAAAGYGLYKGYKFLTRNSASPEATVRMMQYGLSEKQSSHYHDIYNLESELLENGVYYQGRQAIISKQKMNLKNVLEIFNLTEETANGPEGQNFIAWFTNRFKPVFLNHLTSLFAVDGKLSLAEIDKLRKNDIAKFDRYFKAATNTPAVFENTESPFSDIDQLRVTSKDVQAAVDAIRNEYKDKLDEKGNEKVGLIAGAAKKAWSFLTKNEGMENTIKQGGFKGFMTKMVSLIPGVALAKNLLEGGIKLAGSMAVGIRRFFNQALTALESVRFKTYGLKKMKSSQVSSLRNLEDMISTMVIVGGNGKAIFNGDIANIVREVGSEFGLSSVKDEHAENWTKWFNLRFLPVFLNFMGSGFQLTGKKNAIDIEPALKEGQKYDVAVRLSGTSNVWDQDISPWQDEPDLCTSSSECADNIQFLKDKANQEVLDDPKTKAAKKAADTASVKDQMLGGNSAGKPQKLPPSLTRAGSNSLLSPATEGESSKQNDSIQSRAETILQNKIPLASGPLSDPGEGDQFIKMGPGAKIDGVNPELVRNLKMMAAEYGKMTGKSITINSGSRTFAEQTALYRKDPSKAAKPGNSLHEFGLALDVNSDDLNELDRLGLMRKYGFTRPVGGEAWHMEPAGIQKNLDRAKKDPDFASEMIEKSLGLGGGGFGVVANSIKGHRNSNLAASLLDDSVSSSAKEDSVKASDGVTPSAKAPSLADKVNNALKPSTASKATLDKQPTQILARDGKTPPTMVASADSNRTFGRLEAFTETEPGSMASSAPSGQPGDIKSIIADAAKQTGVDPNLMLAFAAVESGLNPSAKSPIGSATGLFQFVDDTWKEMLTKNGQKYKLDSSASPTDPRANALMGGEFLKQNMKELSGIKPNPTATDLYLAHFLGPAGAKKFLKADPGAIAADVMPISAKSNRSIFYDGPRARTVAEVYNFLNNKVHNTAMHHGIAIPAGDGLSTNKIMTAQDGTRPRTATGPLPSTTSVMPASASRTTGPVLAQAPSGPVTGSRPTVASGPILSMPPALPGASPAPIMNVPAPMNMNIGQSDPKLVNIDDTLTQSLAVQMRMLEYLQQIAKTSGNGDQLSAITSGLGELLSGATGNRSRTRGATPIPNPPINLDRAIR